MLVWFWISPLLFGQFLRPKTTVFIGRNALARQQKTQDRHGVWTDIGAGRLEDYGSNSDKFTPA